MMTNEQQPFVGARPFETVDRDLFFGREHEARELKARVQGHPLVLLYSQSGAGKTSLINTRLIPNLREDGFTVLQPMRVKCPFLGEMEKSQVKNIYSFNALLNLEAASGDGSASANGKPEQRLELADKTLSWFLHQYPRKPGGVDEMSPLVLIIDQFEELFSTFPDRWPERRGFLEQIRDALVEVPLLRVLIAMREDYIAHLDPYLDIFSDKVRIRMRLELLRDAAAVRAIDGPLGTTDRQFGKGVANKIVNELLQVRTLNERGEVVSVTGEFVEPVQLQVVCQTLWESLPRDQGLGEDDDRLKKLGDVDQALRLFYDRIIRKAVQETKADERGLRTWISEKLITPGGTRGMANEQDPETKAIPREAIELLVSKHLIRGESRYGSRWFELAHDRFLKPIQESNLGFLQSSKTREDVMERYMGISGVISSAVTAFLVGGDAQRWIVWVIGVAAAVYGGITLGQVAAKIHQRKNPFAGWQACVLILLCGSIIYLIVEMVKANSWWLLGVYCGLMVVYTALGPKMWTGSTRQQNAVSERPSLGPVVK